MTQYTFFFIWRAKCLTARHHCSRSSKLTTSSNGYFWCKRSTTCSSFCFFSFVFIVKISTPIMHFPNIACGSQFINYIIFIFIYFIFDIFIISTRWYVLNTGCRFTANIILNFFNIILN